MSMWNPPVYIPSKGSSLLPRDQRIKCLLTPTHSGKHRLCFAVMITGDEMCDVGFSETSFPHSIHSHTEAL